MFFEFLFGVPLYFLPSIIAIFRNVRSLGAVVIINAFGGWTILLWFVALYKALGDTSVLIKGRPELDSVIAKAKQIDPPVPQGRSERVDPKERDEEKPRSRSASVDKSLAGEAFHIVYRDSSGRMSERRIAIRKISASGNDLYISAFCFKRNALRNFYASRIQEMTDIGSGEVVDNAIEYLKHMMDHKTTSNTMEFDEKDTIGVALETTVPVNVDSIAQCLMPIQAEVIVLVFLSRSDNRMVKSERKAIIDYILFRLQSLAGREDEIDRYLARLYPDKSLFVDVVNEVLAFPSEMQAQIYIALDKVMNADGKVDARELTMIKVYRDALLRAAAA